VGAKVGHRRIPSRKRDSGLLAGVCFSADSRLASAQPKLSVIVGTKVGHRQATLKYNAPPVQPRRALCSMDLAVTCGACDNARRRLTFSSAADQGESKAKKDTAVAPAREQRVYRQCRLTCVVERDIAPRAEYRNRATRQTIRCASRMKVAALATAGGKSSSDGQTPMPMIKCLLILGTGSTLHSPRSRTLKPAGSRAHRGKANAGATA
jgi:hypothetical protein